jgi:[ribosomal protein S5]-alanine N-acetyltransferase
MTLDTARLRLVPLAADQLLALWEGRPHAAEQSGLRPAPSLGDFFASCRSEVSSAWLAQLRTAPPGPDPWAFGFAVVHAESDSMIGTCGFKGPPDADGMVEIAYGITPDYQGQGYATEAAAALVRFASADGRVRVIRAHTKPENNASTRVLTKCGFARLGEVVDPEDGLVWRWERDPDRGEAV